MIRMVYRLLREYHRGCHPVRDLRRQGPRLLLHSSVFDPGVSHRLYSPGSVIAKDVEGRSVAEVEATVSLTCFEDTDPFSLALPQGVARACRACRVWGTPHPLSSIAAKVPHGHGSMDTAARGSSSKSPCAEWPSVGSETTHRQAKSERLIRARNGIDLCDEDNKGFPKSIMQDAHTELGKAKLEPRRRSHKERPPSLPSDPRGAPDSGYGSASNGRGCMAYEFDPRSGSLRKTGPKHRGDAAADASPQARVAGLESPPGVSPTFPRPGVVARHDPVTTSEGNVIKSTAFESAPTGSGEKLPHDENEPSAEERSAIFHGEDRTLSVKRSTASALATRASKEISEASGEGSTSPGGTPLERSFSPELRSTADGESRPRRSERDIGAENHDAREQKMHHARGGESDDDDEVALAGAIPVNVSQGTVGVATLPGNNSLLMEWSPSIGRAASSKRGYVVRGSPGATDRAELEAKGGPRSGETVRRRWRFAESNALNAPEQRSRSGRRTNSFPSSDEKHCGKLSRSQPSHYGGHFRPRNPRPTERKGQARRPGLMDKRYLSHGQHAVTRPSWGASAGLGLEMSPSRCWVRPGATGPLYQGSREGQGVEIEPSMGFGPWVAPGRDCCRGWIPGRRSRAIIVLGLGSRKR